MARNDAGVTRFLSHKQQTPSRKLSQKNWTISVFYWTLPLRCMPTIIYPYLLSMKVHLIVQSYCCADNPQFDSRRFWAFHFYAASSPSSSDVSMRMTPNLQIFFQSQVLRYMGGGLGPNLFLLLLEFINSFRDSLERRSHLIKLLLAQLCINLAIAEDNK